jgi:hypothetical protein
MDSDLAFNFHNARKRLVPTCFQFTSHKAVGRVSGVVLPEGAIGCIARCFEIAHKRVVHAVPPLLSLCFGTTARRAFSTASSTLSPPKAIQRGSPLSIHPRVQL